MSDSSESGVSLVATLLLLALLSSIIVTFIYLNRDTILETSNRAQLAQARAISDGAFELSVFGVQTGLISARAPENGSRICRTKEAIVSIKVEDESGKIDLNGASADLLFDFMSLFVSDSDEAQSIVDRILDYRDADNDARALGAELREYRDFGLLHPPKNRPIQVLDELYQIPGLTDNFIKRASPYLTVYSRRTGIAPEFASLPVLLAATGSDVGLSDDFLSNFPAGELERLRSLVPTGRTIRSTGQTYSVNIQTLQDNGFQYAETVTFSLTGSEKNVTQLERRRLPSSPTKTPLLIEARQTAPNCINLFQE